MAENRRMTPAELADKPMSTEHADVVRESVAWMVADLMDAEVSAQIGAGLGEVAPDRITQRNGYRPRGWDTRAGAIELQIPKLRQGSYFPSFLQPRKRSEQALVAVVQEAYVNGVSTRKVDRLVEQFGILACPRTSLAPVPLTRRARARLSRAPARGGLPVPVVGRQRSSACARQGTSDRSAW
jgi:transposase-like protein